MSSTTPARLALVDALRGIAAMSVVVFHIYKQNLLFYGPAFPEPVHTIFVNGYLGVYIFFVLSGFVIAHSVRGYRVTPTFVGRFALRRSLRLDPPYWAAIVGAVLLAVVAERTGGGSQPVKVPAPADVLAHLFYVQEFVGVPHILGVFWTLCLEIQFYLLYVVCVGLAQRFIADRRWVVFGPLFILSIVVGSGSLDWGRALCLWAWPFFFVGCVTSWREDERIATGTWVVIVLATCGCALDTLAPTAVAVSTAVILFAAGRLRRTNDAPLLQTLSLGVVLQYLGRISYSLYLVHLLIGAKSARLALRLLGQRELGYFEMSVILLGCVAISVASAHILYVVVERVAIKWSKRVTLTPADQRV